MLLRFNVCAALMRFRGNWSGNFTGTHTPWRVARVYAYRARGFLATVVLFFPFTPNRTCTLFTSLSVQLRPS